MTTKHKVIWSIRAILVVVLLIEIGIYWWIKQTNWYIDNMLVPHIEDLNKDLDFFQKKQERKLEGANFIMMGPFQHLPMSTNNVKKTYHDKQEEAWIVGVYENNEVKVQTIDSKIEITFRVVEAEWQKFRSKVNWIAPVTFQCTKKKNGKCDFDSPYKLFVSNGLVEVKQLEFPKK